MRYWLLYIMSMVIMCCAVACTSTPSVASCKALEGGWVCPLDATYLNEHDKLSQSLLDTYEVELEKGIDQLYKKGPKE